MRKYLLALACMMAVVQNAGAQEYFSSASDFARLYVGSIEPQYQTWVWHDNPYYKENADMYTGRISYHGVVYDHVKLRFDQLKQCVVVLPPREKVFCLPEQEYIDWFEMDGHRYVHDPEDNSRFASLLCDGSTNGIRLYHSMWKIYSGEKNLDGRKYLKTLHTEEQYTLITSDGEKHHVKRASDVAKLFPEQKKQIKQFAKKNRLYFSKSERENSLVKVVKNIMGSPLPASRGDGSFVTSAYITKEPSPRDTLIDEKKLIAGIPVLDSDSVAMAVASSKTKVYVVPGAKKAKASVSDNQELDEIVVVGGRQSAVKNMMMGSEKFKPVILKNIPSAFGESDIMKIVLTLPGVTTIGEASSGYNRHTCSDYLLLSIQMPLRMWNCSSQVFLWNTEAG